MNELLSQEAANDHRVLVHQLKPHVDVPRQVDRRGERGEDVQRVDSLVLSEQFHHALISELLIQSGDDRRGEGLAVVGGQEIAAQVIQADVGRRYREVVFRQQHFLSVSCWRSTRRAARPRPSEGARASPPGRRPR